MFLVFLLNWICGKVIWVQKKGNTDNIACQVSDILKEVDPPSFPNIFAILKLLAAIPVTCSSYERSISCLTFKK